MAVPDLTHLLLRLTRGMAAEASDEPDCELVRRFLATRDERAFEALVRRHGPMVYRVCLRVAGNDQDAEDAFQATFLVLAQNLGALRARASLASWLHGVARRVTLKARAAAAARGLRERAASRSERVPPADPGWAEVRAALDEELACLPERWRQPLVLCHLEGRTQDEAARALGWSNGTLRRRLADAREALAGRLARRGVWPGVLAAALASDCAAPAALAPGQLSPLLISVAGGESSAAGVPSTVLALAKGVCPAMVLKRVKLVAAAALLAAALGTSSYLYRSPAADPPGPTSPARATAPPAPKPVAGRAAGANKLLLFRAERLALTDPDGENGRALNWKADRPIGPVARVSPDGKMVAALVQMRQAPGEEGLPPMRLHVRRLAKDEPWVDLGVKCESFAWSPDGTEIACSDFPDMDFVLPRDPRSPGATHLVVNVATKQTTALKLSTDHVITDWSQDGEHFLTTAVAGRAKDGPRLYLMNRDGTAHKALADGKEPAMFGRLSPDGKRVLYTSLIAPDPKKVETQGGSVLRVLDIASKNLVRVDESGDITSYCWSPDGKRIAYTWREVHEGKILDLLDKETESHLVVCDPDGKNRKTIVKEKARGPTALAIFVADWH